MIYGLLILGGLIILILCWITYDFLRNNSIQKLPSKPERELKINIDDILNAFANNTEPDFTIIKSTMEFIAGRYDTSDFKLQSVIRILHEYKEKLSSEDYLLIKSTILDYKYWMDQNGEDSICFWSENHQLLFATSEYLLGHYYSDETFTNQDITGSQHSILGKERLLIWLEQRWLYGFTEFYSNTYYVEDIAPLANLIDYAHDDEIRIKAKIIMDLLLNDVATQSFKGTFATVSGRM